MRLDVETKRQSIQNDKEKKDNRTNIVSEIYAKGQPHKKDERKKEMWEVENYFSSGFPDAAARVTLTFVSYLIMLHR